MLYGMTSKNIIGASSIRYNVAFEKCFFCFYPFYYFDFILFVQGLQHRFREEDSDEFFPEFQELDSW